MSKINPTWRKELSQLCARYGLQGVVAIAIREDGVVEAHTWGVEPRRCAALGKWIDGFIERGLSVIPFQTVFGWGNGGKPKGLGPGQVAPAGWEEFT